MSIVPHLPAKKEEPHQRGFSVRLVFCIVLRIKAGDIPSSGKRRFAVFTSCGRAYLGFASIAVPYPEGRCKNSRPYALPIEWSSQGYPGLCAVLRADGGLRSSFQWTSFFPGNGSVVTSVRRRAPRGVGHKSQWRLIR